MILIDPGPTATHPPPSPRRKQTVLTFPSAAHQRGELPRTQQCREACPRHTERRRPSPWAAHSGLWDYLMGVHVTPLDIRPFSGGPTNHNSKGNTIATTRQDLDDAPTNSPVSPRYDTDFPAHRRTSEDRVTSNHDTIDTTSLEALNVAFGVRLELIAEQQQSQQRQARLQLLTRGRST